MRGVASAFIACFVFWLTQLRETDDYQSKKQSCPELTSTRSGSVSEFSLNHSEWRQVALQLLTSHADLGSGPHVGKNAHHLRHISVVAGRRALGNVIEMWLTVSRQLPPNSMLSRTALASSPVCIILNSVRREYSRSAIMLCFGKSNRPIVKMISEATELARGKVWFRESAPGKSQRQFLWYSRYHTQMAVRACGGDAPGGR